jgi:tyrosyl-tRNA synthetase
MSVPDKALLIYHKLILGWSPSQLAALKKGIESGEQHPNEVKMRLAREIVSIFHSPESAESAQKHWDEVFRSHGGLPEDMPEEVLEQSERVLDILRRLNYVASGAEAKRLMQQNGIRLNEQPVTDPTVTVTLDMLPAVLQVGKRKFVRLIAKS